MKTLDLARTYHAVTGYPLFFCDDRKRPTKKGGFHNAASTPEGITELYRAAPGPLIACPTGAASGVSVLDIDAIKHSESAAWFWQHAERLQTLTIETRSGGWHCYFHHRPGLTCTTRLFGVDGVDIRASLGYVIAWGAHGHRTLLQAPVAPWPSWLTVPAETRPERLPAPARLPDDASLARLVRWVADAREGERNSRLFWAGCRMAEQVRHGTVTTGFAGELLRRAGTDAGLPAIEVQKTIASALGGGAA
jgi:hypothetical protein